MASVFRVEKKITEKEDERGLKGEGTGVEHSKGTMKLNIERNFEDDD